MRILIAEVKCEMQECARASNNDIESEKQRTK
jgi:hypothetical protein